MKNRLLFLALCFFFTSDVSAQIVGTDCFLQGKWLEVGVNPMSGLGTCTSPATYHTHGCPYTFGPPLAVSAQMDASYDWGHDGWTVAVPATAPSCMGPYTQPGYPQEGWSLQVGATEYRNGGWGGACAGSFDIPGTHIGYTNSGGSAIDYWNGNIVGLNITQQTRVDTFASSAVITTVIRNTTLAPIANIYYQRTNDPDNSSGWGGGSTTRNRIVHQNEDARHMVMISSNSETGVFNVTNTYMALATKDCRARCAGISGLWPSSTPSAMWNAVNSGSGGSGTTIFTLGASNIIDAGITLVFNLGTIAAGDSTVISYAYVYDGPDGIDSAFPNPTLRIDGDTFASMPPPVRDFDTFDACLLGASATTVPIDIMFSEDKCWSWSSWTWSPGTGLSSTTGSHVTVTLSALPPSITYTITGTDSSGFRGSCQNKTFYLTILTCNGATSNAPCVGDTLFFNAPGDSTFATYKWYGPAPSTAVFSTSQANWRYPAAMTDTGTYTVIKTVAGLDDTATTYVRVNALPVLGLTSNIPPCAPFANPLNLFCTPDSVCTSFSWTGPGGFTSTMQNPSIVGFDSALAGVYVVEAISNKGCRNSNSIHIKPAAIADFSFDAHPGCPFDTLFVTNNSYNANVFSWSWQDGTGNDPNRSPAPHFYTTANKVYTVTLTASNAYCTNSKSLEVDMKHSVTADFAAVKDTICNGEAVVINDLSTSTRTKLLTPVTPLFSHDWSWGDLTANDVTNGSPSNHTYPSEGAYPVTLTVTDLIGCTNTKTKYIHVLQPYIFGISDTTFCLTQPTMLYNTIVTKAMEPKGYGYSYSWSPATNLSSSTVREPYFRGIGQFVYTLTATFGPGHFDCPAYFEYKLNSILPRQIKNVTQDTKIMYGKSIQLNADSTLYYTWTPNDGSLNDPNINNPIATPTVTTAYTLYGMDYYGCRDTAHVIVYVDSTMTEFIPTGFTPNGDGLNDVFRLNGSKFHKMVEFRIYNRWGQQVFYSTNVERGWDGTFEGVPMDMGVYHYSVIVARPGHAENAVYKGEVTLIR